MLPAVTFKFSAIKRTAIATMTALAIAAVPAAPAMAWGQREQDVLKGVVGTLLVQGLIREAKRPQRNQPVYQQPVYQQPVYLQPEPVYQPPHYQTTSIYRTPAARAFQSYSFAERRMIQKRLSNYGYYRGGIDGSFGPGTYSAVTSYAEDQGQSRQLASTNAAFGVYDGLIY